MTYLKAREHLNSFINYERQNSYPYQSSFRLERARRLLQSLGSPQEALRATHIAGTKGKGSTCIFVANVLKEAGFRVGLYTSPHLVDVRERIRVLPEEEIAKKDFSGLIKKIKPQAEKLRQTKLGSLSYYEILTALAFLYFKEKRCDFVVLETGIGGRLDATNLVSSLVCAITPISYEHTEVLGNTLGEIAAEKAAIIKDKSQIVITAPQRPSVLAVIRRRAKKIGAELRQVGEDIQITGLKVGLLGRHQIINATVAVGCLRALRCLGVKISPEAIKEGLKNTRWPGRLEIISRRPKIILDAAHNQASASALKEALDKFFKFRKLILVFGVSQDKDVKGILKELAPQAARIILTKANSPRAMQPEVIKSFIKANGRVVSSSGNPQQALKVARQSAGQKDLILVCGSLYLLGEVLKSERQ